MQQGVESGEIQKSMLKAIIADEDISKEDLKFMQKLVEKATTSGSLFVHDKGIHDRLDLILKGLDFATNSAKLATASAPVVSGGGGGTTNVTPVVINAPTQSSIANTKVETSIGLNDPFTHLERAY